MSAHSQRARLEHAVARVVDSPDVHGVTQSLCAGAVSVAGTVWAALEDRSAGARRPIAFAQSGGGAYPGSGTPGVGVVEFVSDTGEHYALLIPGPVSQATRDDIALLTQTAMATAEMLLSEQHLHHQRLRLDALRDQLSELDPSLHPSRATGPMSAEFASAAALLTERERQVLEQVLSGAANAAIAGELGVSLETVKTHVKRILRKMGAANRAELISRSR
ncbi:helix-turn-helix transcriptional regulator [Gordonia asplenii]|nr:LuxR C-terminal-related transcriptional regulator [Gordonia asplenii]